jgi:transcriptional regulator with XRE-family HTH domain
MRIQFVGHPDGADVHLPDGPTVQVGYEQVQTFPDAVARSLLEQGEGQWRLVSHYGDHPSLEALQGVSASGLAGRAVAAYRTSLGWSQTQLAERLTGVGCPLSQSAVSRLESGDRTLSVDELISVAAVMNVSPIRLLEGASLPDQPAVAVTATVSVPGSRYRSWLRGNTPLPPAKDWRKRTGSSWSAAYRQAVADQDWLHRQRLTIHRQAEAGREIVDAAIQVRDQLTDESRTRLADAIDHFDRIQQELEASTTNYPSQRARPERRGRPRRSTA